MHMDEDRVGLIRDMADCCSIDVGVTRATKPRAGPDLIISQAAVIELQ